MKPRRARPVIPVKSPIYGNWLFTSPGGEPLFRCGNRKANWYIDRGIAEKVSDNKARLLFDPKGPGGRGDEYAMSDKENRCVVCGSLDGLTRHHVVPWCYRRWFPLDYKFHDFHDILPVCIGCHGAYEDVAEGLKDEVSRKYPVTAAKFDAKARKAGSAWHALDKHSDKIPEDRQRRMRAMVKEYFGREKEDVSRAEASSSGDYGGFGYWKELVRQIEDIPAFVRMWRTHFIKHMSPMFLPQGWNIDRPSKRAD